MKNSTRPDTTRIKVENGVMFNELMSSGNYQGWLRDDFKKRETREATFMANGLNSIMEFMVMEAGISQEVDGKTYPEVIMVESESKIEMNGTRISTNFSRQYYYAKGTGLILTTSYLGDVHALQSFEVNQI